MRDRVKRVYDFHQYISDKKMVAVFHNPDHKLHEVVVDFLTKFLKVASLYYLHRAAPELGPLLKSMVSVVLHISNYRSGTLTESRTNRVHRYFET